MSPAHAALIFIAAVWAGGINTVVGSGTLVTFPTLLALGYPPVLANVSNNIGLVPGSLSGTVGYRAELAGQRARLLRLAAASAAGSLIGALLLLSLPSGAFSAVVPVLIGLGCVLVVLQPWISRVAAAVRPRADSGVASWPLAVLVLLTGIYGGYFGAAQGVLLVAILGIALDETLQRINAAKNLLATTVNGVAAVVFISVTSVDWWVVLVIAVGSTVGGVLGARVGRRIPAPVFRGIVAVVGLAAIVRLVFFS